MADTLTTDIPVKRTFKLSHISKSVLIIAVFFGLDKVLALARQIIIGRTFALSRELDAFNAANNLPDMLYAMITGGALAIALIPVLSETLEKDGRRSMWDLFSRVVNLGFLVTAGLAVIIALLANRLVGWRLGIAPGFDDPLQDLVVELMRINLFGTLIFSLSGMVMAGLQANQHFLFPALAPGLYNIGQIFGAAVLAPEEGLSLGPIHLPAFGLGIHGLLYGVLIGAALHLAVQVPGLIKYRFHWIPRIDLHNPGLGKVLVLMGPRLISMVFIQLIFLARDNLASRLTQGSVSALTYGWFIMQVPETLIGTAIATALLPSLAELITRGDREAFAATINRSLKAMLALTLPVSALVFTGVRPLVQIAFNFSPADTELVVWATRAFTVGLVGHSIFEVAARAFYAQQDPKPPVITSAYRFIAYLLLAVLLYRPLDAAGIGLADALAITSEAAILIFILNRRFPGIFKVGWTLPRAVIGMLAAGVISFLILEFLSLPLIILTAVALGAGLLVALPFMWPELRGLVRL